MTLKKKQTNKIEGPDKSLIGIPKQTLQRNQKDNHHLIPKLK